MNNHRCTIILVDERVGEMEYQVVGKGLLPKPIDIAGMSRYLDKAEPVVLNIPFENKQILAGFEEHWRLRFVGRSREKDIFYRVNERLYDEGKFFYLTCDSRYLACPQNYVAIDLEKAQNLLLKQDSTKQI